MKSKRPIIFLYICFIILLAFLKSYGEDNLFKAVNSFEKQKKNITKIPSFKKNKQIKIFLQTGHSNAVSSVCYSRDGKYIASGSADDTVKLWEVETGLLIKTFYHHVNNVISVAFTSDDRFILSSTCSTVKSFEVSSGKLINTFQQDSDERRFDCWHLKSVSFSPDGQHIASVCRDNTIKLWEAESEKLINTIQGNSIDLNYLRLSPDGRRIVTGSSDNTVKLFEVGSGKLISTFQGHSNYITSVSFSPDGQFIASGSNDKTVKLWEAESGKLIETFQGHDSIVLSVSFNPNGRSLASGSFDKTIKLWDVKSGNLIKTIQGHNGSINSISFNPNGRSLASGSSDNSIKFWDIETGKLIKSIEGFYNKVNSVSLSTDGRHIASGSLDKTVKLWWAQSGVLIRTLQGHNDNVNSVRFSSDNQSIVSGSFDKTVKLWDTNSGKLLRTFKGHTDHVRSVNYSPDGSHIASGSLDKTVKLWEVKSGRLIKTFKGHKEAVNSVCFNHTGHELASGSSSGRIKLWKVVHGNFFAKFFNTLVVNPFSGGLISTFFEYQCNIHSICFSPNSKFIVSGQYSIELWEVKFRKNIKTINEYGYVYVYSVDFSPDGRFIASGSSDNTVNLWDTESGHLLKTFQGHADSVLTVKFSPDGKRICSGSSDNTIKFWDINSNKSMTIALLPNNEWLSFTSDSLFYHSSLNGDNYAAIRFNNNSYNFKPLSDFRSTYKRNNFCINRSIVSIISPLNMYRTEQQSEKIEAQIDCNNSKIFNIKISVNNNIVKKEKFTPTINNKTFKFDVNLIEGKNIVRIDVRNDENCETFDQIQIYREIKKIKGDLFLFSVGVNHLENISNNDLKYAVNDAIDISRIMKKLEGKIYNNVYSYIYTDLSTMKPYSNIIINDIKTHSKKATLNDTLMIFFAGHGISINKKKYIFLTRDAKRSDYGDFFMDTVLNWNSINGVLKQLTCMKIIILDTCYTYGVDILPLLQKENDLNAISNMHNRIILLTSTSEKQVAEECEKFTNGCFTHAIKVGLGEFFDYYQQIPMPADYNNDNMVSILELLIFIPGELEKLTYTQKPFISLPNGNNDFILYKR